MAFNTKKYLDKKIDIKEDIGTNMSAHTFEKLGKAQKESLEEIEQSLLGLCGHGITDLDCIKPVLEDIKKKKDMIHRAIQLRWIQESEKV